MPAGDKIAVSIMIQTQTVQMNTWTPAAEIKRQIEGPLTEEDDAVWARFECVNVNDQAIIVNLLRGEIFGHICSPIVRQAVASGKGILQ